MRLTRTVNGSDEYGELSTWNIIDAEGRIVDLDDDWDYLEGRAIWAGIVKESLNELPHEE